MPVFIAVGDRDSCAESNGAGRYGSYALYIQVKVEAVYGSRRLAAKNFLAKKNSQDLN